jgi:predicted nuclease of restriction endonuclease-like (RecB) superfamily
MTEIPWGHNLVLLFKLTDPLQRLWYAQKTVQHGWSRTILEMQIQSNLYHRQGKAVTNFAATLPPPQSDLAQQALKDPYLFDFLTLGDEAHERDLEGGLVGHVKKFLLELGAGFAFVGRRVHLEVGEDDFYITLTGKLEAAPLAPPGSDRLIVPASTHTTGWSVGSVVPGAGAARRGSLSRRQHGTRTPCRSPGRSGSAPLGSRPV